MMKDETLLLLRDLGIAEDTGDFSIKKDVPSDMGYIIRTLSYAKIPKDKITQLATILNQRLSESNAKISAYSICIK